MKKARVVLPLVAIMLLLIVSLANAQYAGYYIGTVYQVVNPGIDPVDVTITYYDGDGAVAATRTIEDLAGGASQLVRVPSEETTLGEGLYSASVSSLSPVQVIVNEELYPDGNTTSPVPPFASYAGVSEGATTVYLTAVMYNYFNYYTDMFIMNVGTADANVEIEYIPGEQGGIVTGAPLTETAIVIPMNASILHSQKDMTALGAPDGSGYFTGRFLGSAIITSDQPLAVVVNQHNTVATKLMTYNGITEGSTMQAVPVHMRGYYGYYTATTVLNLDETLPACVKFTYTPNADRSLRSDGGDASAVVEVVHVIDPLMSILRYDGTTATDDQSDLDDDIPFTRFYGALAIESVTGTYGETTCATAVPVAVQINTESIPTGSSQGGSTLGSDVNMATTSVSLPIILSDFYTYYTSTQILNLTGAEITCEVTYTSGPESSVPGHTATYTHTIPANSLIDLYEGTGGGERGDINTDAQWCASGACRFLGAAVVTCDGDIVSFTNEERNINLKDSMYSWNDFNVLP